MVRAWLHEDPVGPWVDRPAMRPVEVTLSDDPLYGDPLALLTPDIPYGPPGPGDPGAQVLHTFTVLKRTRTGYDDDGNPKFDWAEVVAGPAFLFEEREEFDEVAGLSYVQARLTIGYDGPEQLQEAAVVRRDDDVMYRVTSAKNVLDGLQIVMARIDGGG